MKTKKTRTKTPIKAVIIAAAAVLLLAGGYAVTAYTQSWWPFTSQNNNSEQSPSEELPTDEPGTGVDQPADEDDEIIKDGEGTKEETVKEDENSSSTPGDFSVTLKPTSPSAGVVRIGTIISKVTNSGSCSLTLTKGSSTISRTNVGIQSVSSYSTCKFNSVIGVASGTWKATVKVTINGKTVSSSKEVVVE